MIHEATGGRWGLASAPVLRLGALCALPLPIFFAVLLTGLKTLYPWADGAAASAPDVAHFYFNVPAFAAVGLVALIGSATIGAFLAVGALGLLGASIALVFHGFAVSLVAVQWMLSIDPRYSDSAFGTEIAVQQIMLALAAIATVQPRRSVAIADGDIGALLFATSLGAFYLGLRTFIVKWYGDQAVDAAWYLARAWAPGRLFHGRGAVRRHRANRRLRMGARPGEPFGVAGDGRLRHRRDLSPCSLPCRACGAESHGRGGATGFRHDGMVSLELAPYFDRPLAPRIAEMRTQERPP